MNVLIFLGVAAGAIVAMIVYYAVANECEQSRHEKLLTAPATYCLGAAAWLIYGGMGWTDFRCKKVRFRLRSVAAA